MKRKTSFADPGFIEGLGTISDNYDEDSGGKYFGPRERIDPCRLPHDRLKRQDWEELNSPVIIIEEGKEVKSE